MTQHVIEIEAAADDESVEVVMDFFADMLKQGYEVEDVVASMLCVVSVVMESRGEVAAIQ